MATKPGNGSQVDRDRASGCSSGRRRSSDAWAETNSPSRLRCRKRNRSRRGAGRGVLRTVTQPLTCSTTGSTGRCICRHCLGAAATAASGCASPRRHRDGPCEKRPGARPVWFDEGMERALIAQGEIEQGIRLASITDSSSLFRAAGRLATGEVVGFEVLARWNHPLSGVIGPDVFIPIAEEIGLIGRLSQQVISEALRETAEWDQGSRFRSISPRRSWPTAGSRADRAHTRRNGFPAERLVVEITESSLFADMDMARSIVNSLKNQGIRLALDDFGTGSRPSRISGRFRSTSSRSTAASS